MKYRRLLANNDLPIKFNVSIIKQNNKILLHKFDIKNLYNILTTDKFQKDKKYFYYIRQFFINKSSTEFEYAKGLNTCDGDASLPAILFRL